jgi:hypothetical protein
VGYDDWYSRLRDVNDSVLALASSKGLLREPVTCAVDYTKVPYYGEFNRCVVRSEHKDGTDHFYEYATMSRGTACEWDSLAGRGPPRTLSCPTLATSRASTILAPLMSRSSILPQPAHSNPLTDSGIWYCCCQSRAA